MSRLPIFVIILFVVLQHSSAQKTTALFSPVTKDEATNLFTMLVYMKTPLQPEKLHLDLGSYLSIYDCIRHYKSSSYQTVYSNSSLCQELDTKVSGNCFDAPGPGCAMDACEFFPVNSVTQKTGAGQILIDKLALFTAKPGKLGPVSDFVFSCTQLYNSKIYRGFARGVKGLAALGRFNYSLPAQLSRSFSSPQIFALCLPSSSKADGMVLFNSPGPYYFSNSQIDLSKSLIYTPLILGPKQADSDLFYWYKSPDYYIGLTSIKVNSKVVPLNKTLLTIDEIGSGGTKISTSRPYAVLQTTIFKSLINVFAHESVKFNFTSINPVKPFSLCYATQSVKITHVGPVVPTINLVLQSNSIIWRIYGSNSMVRVTTKDVDAWCLGIVDGGSNAKTSIIIGGHQLEDNLLQFDLESSRLGFISTPLSRSTSCADFDFKSIKN